MTDFDVVKWLTTITVIIGAITGVIVAIKKFCKETEPLCQDQLWQKGLKPLLKFVAVSLTLIIPVGAIVWYFVFRIAEDWAPIIRNRDVFLSVVAWLTVFVSAYSLLWGMWLYPTIIRPWFNKRKTKKLAKENKVNENEVDENKNQNQSVQSPNVAELNQQLNNQEGGTL